MDDVFKRIEDLLAKDPRAAAELADKVLLQVRDDGLLLTARTLRVWGGVRRSQGDWSSAEASYALARHHQLIAGAGPEHWLDWHGRMAFLRRDQRRLDKAEDHADEAVRLAREIGDSVVIGRALVDLAIVTRYTDTQQARLHAKAALELLPDGERRSRIAALHVILGCLCNEEDADLDEMTQLLNDARALGDDTAPFARVKLLWFDGLVTLRRGEPDAAPILRQAFDGLVKHGAYVNAATCALDLAQAYLEADEKASAFAVAGLIFPVLKELRHDAEASKALRIFCRSAEAEALDVGVVREVRERLARRR